jgi:c-di-GMP-binding flagellar brake protein YcgR
MAEFRKHMRVDCFERCNLHIKNSHCSAIVKNISLGGVFVQFYGNLSDVQIGDFCRVGLKDERTCEYNCEVVRVEKSNVALRFIDINYL